MFVHLFRNKGTTRQVRLGHLNGLRIKNNKKNKANNQKLKKINKSSKIQQSCDGAHTNLVRKVNNPCESGKLPPAMGSLQDGKKCRIAPARASRISLNDTNSFEYNGIVSLLTKISGFRYIRTMGSKTKVVKPLTKCTIPLNGGHCNYFKKQKKFDDETVKFCKSLNEQPKTTVYSLGGDNSEIVDIKQKPKSIKAKKITGVANRVSPFSLPMSITRGWTIPNARNVWTKLSKLRSLNNIVTSEQVCLLKFEHVNDEKCKLINKSTGMSVVGKYGKVNSSEKLVKNLAFPVHISKDESEKFFVIERDEELYGPYFKSQSFGDVITIVETYDKVTKTAEVKYKVAPDQWQKCSRGIGRLENENLKTYDEYVKLTNSERNHFTSKRIVSGVSFAQVTGDSNSNNIVSNKNELSGPFECISPNDDTLIVRYTETNLSFNSLKLYEVTCEDGSDAFNALVLPHSGTVLSESFMTGTYFKYGSRCLALSQFKAKENAVQIEEHEFMDMLETSKDEKDKMSMSELESDLNRRFINRPRPSAGTASASTGAIPKVNISVDAHQLPPQRSMSFTPTRGRGRGRGAIRGSGRGRSFVAPRSSVFTSIGAVAKEVVEMNVEINKKIEKRQAMVTTTVRVLNAKKEVKKEELNDPKVQLARGSKVKLDDKVMQKVCKNMKDLSFASVVLSIIVLLHILSPCNAQTNLINIKVDNNGMPIIEGQFPKLDMNHVFSYERSHDCNDDGLCEVKFENFIKVNDKYFSYNQFVEMCQICVKNVKCNELPYCKSYFDGDYIRNPVVRVKRQLPQNQAVTTPSPSKVSGAVTCQLRIEIVDKYQKYVINSSKLAYHDALRVCHDCFYSKDCAAQLKCECDQLNIELQAKKNRPIYSIDFDELESMNEKDRRVLANEIRSHSMTIAVHGLNSTARVCKLKNIVRSGVFTVDHMPVVQQCLHSMDIKGCNIQTGVYNGVDYQWTEGQCFSYDDLVVAHKVQLTPNIDKLTIVQPDDLLQITHFFPSKNEGLNCVQDPKCVENKKLDDIFKSIGEQDLETIILDVNLWSELTEMLQGHYKPSCSEHTLFCKYYSWIIGRVDASVGGVFMNVSCQVVNAAKDVFSIANATVQFKDKNFICKTESNKYLSKFGNVKVEKFYRSWRVSIDTAAYKDTQTIACIEVGTGHVQCYETGNRLNKSETHSLNGYKLPSSGLTITAKSGDSMTIIGGFKAKIVGHCGFGVSALTPTKMLLIFPRGSSDMYDPSFYIEGELNTYQCATRPNICQLTEGSTIDRMIQFPFKFQVCASDTMMSVQRIGATLNEAEAKFRDYADKLLNDPFGTLIEAPIKGTLSTFISRLQTTFTDVEMIDIIMLGLAFFLFLMPLTKPISFIVLFAWLSVKLSGSLALDPNRVCGANEPTSIIKASQKVSAFVDINTFRAGRCYKFAFHTSVDDVRGATLHFQIRTIRVSLETGNSFYVPKNYDFDRHHDWACPKGGTVKRTSMDYEPNNIAYVTRCGEKYSAGIADYGCFYFGNIEVCEVFVARSVPLIDTVECVRVRPNAAYIIDYDAVAITGGTHHASKGSLRMGQSVDIAGFKITLGDLATEINLPFKWVCFDHQRNGWAIETEIEKSNTYWLTVVGRKPTITEAHIPNKLVMCDSFSPNSVNCKIAKNNVNTFLFDNYAYSINQSSNVAIEYTTNGIKTAEFYKKQVTAKLTVKVEGDPIYQFSEDCKVSGCEIVSHANLEPVGTKMHYVVTIYCTIDAPGKNKNTFLQSNGCEIVAGDFFNMTAAQHKIQTIVTLACGPTITQTTINICDKDVVWNITSPLFNLKRLSQISWNVITDKYEDAKIHLDDLSGWLSSLGIKQVFTFWFSRVWKFCLLAVAVLLIWALFGPIWGLLAVIAGLGSYYLVGAEELTLEDIEDRTYAESLTVAFEEIKYGAHATMVRLKTMTYEDRAVVIFSSVFTTALTLLFLVTWNQINRFSTGMVQLFVIICVLKFFGKSISAFAIGFLTKSTIALRWDEIKFLIIYRKAYLAKNYLFGLLFIILISNITCANVDCKFDISVDSHKGYSGYLHEIKKDWSINSFNFTDYKFETDSVLSYEQFNKKFRSSSLSHYYVSNEKYDAKMSHCCRKQYNDYVEYALKGVSYNTWFDYGSECVNIKIEGDDKFVSKFDKCIMSDCIVILQTTNSDKIKHSIEPDMFVRQCKDNSCSWSKSFSNFIFRHLNLSRVAPYIPLILFMSMRWYAGFGFSVSDVIYMIIIVINHLLPNADAAVLSKHMFSESEHVNSAVFSEEQLYQLITITTLIGTRIGKKYITQKGVKICLTLKKLISTIESNLDTKIDRLPRKNLHKFIKCLIKGYSIKKHSRRLLNRQLDCINLNLDDTTAINTPAIHKCNPLLYKDVNGAGQETGMCAETGGKIFLGDGFEYTKIDRDLELLCIKRSATMKLPSRITKDCPSIRSELEIGYSALQRIQALFGLESRWNLNLKNMGSIVRINYLGKQKYGFINEDDETHDSTLVTTLHDGGNKPLMSKQVFWENDTDVQVSEDLYTIRPEQIDAEKDIAQYGRPVRFEVPNQLETYWVYNPNGLNYGGGKGAWIAMKIMNMDEVSEGKLSENCTIRYKQIWKFWDPVSQVFYNPTRRQCAGMSGLPILSNEMKPVGILSTWVKRGRTTGYIPRDANNTVTSQSTLDEQAKMLQKADPSSFKRVHLPTGSGKSTELPYLLYTKYARNSNDTPCILVLNPLINSVEQLERYMKSKYKMNEVYKCSSVEKTTTGNKRGITYMTYGSFNKIRDIKKIVEQYDYILFDEYHQMDTEIIYSLMKFNMMYYDLDYMQEHGHRLPVVALMSATSYFDSISERNPNPKIKYHQRNASEESFKLGVIPKTATGTIPFESKFIEAYGLHIEPEEFIMNKKYLIFLPTKRDCDNIAEWLNRKFHDCPKLIRSYYSKCGQTPNEFQDMVNSYNGLVIVCATNYIESGVTIDFDCVYDTRARMIPYIEWDSQFYRFVRTMELVKVSPGEAVQRAGRVGRMKPGDYIYAVNCDVDRPKVETEHVFNALAAFRFFEEDIWTPLRTDTLLEFLPEFVKENCNLQLCKLFDAHLEYADTDRKNVLKKFIDKIFCEQGQTEMAEWMKIANFLHNCADADLQNYYAPIRPEYLRAFNNSGEISLLCEDSRMKMWRNNRGKVNVQQRLRMQKFMEKFAPYDLLQESNSAIKLMSKFVPMKSKVADIFHKGSADKNQYFEVLCHAYEGGMADFTYDGSGNKPIIPRSAIASKYMTASSGGNVINEILADEEGQSTAKTSLGPIIGVATAVGTLAVYTALKDRALPVIEEVYTLESGVNMSPSCLWDWATDCHFWEKFGNNGVSPLVHNSEEILINRPKYSEEDLKVDETKEDVPDRAVAFTKKELQMISEMTDKSVETEMRLKKGKASSMAIERLLKDKASMARELVQVDESLLDLGDDNSRIAEQNRQKFEDQKADLELRIKTAMEEIAEMQQGPDYLLYQKFLLNDESFKACAKITAGYVDNETLECLQGYISKCSKYTENIVQNVGTYIQEFDLNWQQILERVTMTFGMSWVTISYDKLRENLGVLPTMIILAAFTCWTSLTFGVIRTVFMLIGSQILYAICNNKSGRERHGTENFFVSHLMNLGVCVYKLYEAGQSGFVTTVIDSMIGISPDRVCEVAGTVVPVIAKQTALGAFTSMLVASPTNASCTNSIHIALNIHKLFVGLYTKNIGKKDMAAGTSLVLQAILGNPMNTIKGLIIGMTVSVIDCLLRFNEERFRLIIKTVVKGNFADRDMFKEFTDPENISKAIHMLMIALSMVLDPVQVIQLGVSALSAHLRGADEDLIQTLHKTSGLSTIVWFLYEVKEVLNWIDNRPNGASKPGVSISLTSKDGLYENIKASIQNLSNIGEGWYMWIPNLFKYIFSTLLPRKVFMPIWRLVKKIFRGIKEYWKTEGQITLMQGYDHVKSRIKSFNPFGSISCNINKNDYLYINGDMTMKITMMDRIPTKITKVIIFGICDCSVKFKTVYKNEQSKTSNTFTLQREHIYCCESYCYPPRDTGLTITEVLQSAPNCSTIAIVDNFGKSHICSKSRYSKTVNMETILGKITTPSIPDKIWKEYGNYDGNINRCLLYSTWNNLSNSINNKNKSIKFIFRCVECGPGNWHEQTHYYRSGTLCQFIINSWGCHTSKHSIMEYELCDTIDMDACNWVSYSEFGDIERACLCSWEVGVINSINKIPKYTDNYTDLDKELMFVHTNNSVQNVGLIGRPENLHCNGFVSMTMLHWLGNRDEIIRRSKIWSPKIAIDSVCNTWIRPMYYDQVLEEEFTGFVEGMDVLCPAQIIPIIRDNGKWIARPVGSDTVVDSDLTKMIELLEAKIDYGELAIEDFIIQNCETRDLLALFVKYGDKKEYENIRYFIRQNVPDIDEIAKQWSIENGKMSDYDISLTVDDFWASPCSKMYSMLLKFKLENPLYNLGYKINRMWEAVKNIEWKNLPGKIYSFVANIIYTIKDGFKAIWDHINCCRVDKVKEQRDERGVSIDETMAYSKPGLAVATEMVDPTISVVDFLTWQEINGELPFSKQGINDSILLRELAKAIIDQIDLSNGVHTLTLKLVQHVKQICCPFVEYPEYIKFNVFTFTPMQIEEVTLADGTAIVDSGDEQAIADYFADKNWTDQAIDKDLFPSNFDSYKEFYGRYQHCYHYVRLLITASCAVNGQATDWMTAPLIPPRNFISEEQWEHWREDYLSQYINSMNKYDVEIAASTSNASTPKSQSNASIVVEASIDKNFTPKTETGKVSDPEINEDFASKLKQSRNNKIIKLNVDRLNLQYSDNCMDDDEKVLVPIKGDGNCLFRSISYGLFGHQEEAIRLKLILRATSFSESDNETYRSALNTEIPTCVAEWGTTDHAAAICALLNRNLCIHGAAGYNHFITNSSMPTIHVQFVDNDGLGHFNVYQSLNDPFATVLSNSTVDKLDDIDSMIKEVTAPEAIEALAYVDRLTNKVDRLTSEAESLQHEVEEKVEQSLTLGERLQNAILPEPVYQALERISKNPYDIRSYFRKIGGDPMPFEGDWEELKKRFIEAPPEGFVIVGKNVIPKVEKDFKKLSVESLDEYETSSDDDIYTTCSDSCETLSTIEFMTWDQLFLSSVSDDMDIYASGAIQEIINNNKVLSPRVKFIDCVGSCEDKLESIDQKIDEIEEHKKEIDINFRGSQTAVDHCTAEVLDNGVGLVPSSYPEIGGETKESIFTHQNLPKMIDSAVEVCKVNKVPVIQTIEVAERLIDCRRNLSIEKLVKISEEELQMEPIDPDTIVHDRTVCIVKNGKTLPDKPKRNNLFIKNNIGNLLEKTIEVSKKVGLNTTEQFEVADRMLTARRMLSDERIDKFENVSTGDELSLTSIDTGIKDYIWKSNKTIVVKKGFQLKKAENYAFKPDVKLVNGIKIKGIPGFTDVNFEKSLDCYDNSGHYNKEEIEEARIQCDDIIRNVHGVGNRTWYKTARAGKRSRPDAGAVVSRGYFKFHEIDETFRVDNWGNKSLFVAEGRGGFLQCYLRHLHEWNKSTLAKVYISTGFNRIRERPHIVEEFERPSNVLLDQITAFTKEGVMDENDIRSVNVRYFISNRCTDSGRQMLDFIVCDGGESGRSQADAAIDLDEFCIAILDLCYLCLKIGGNLIWKTNDLFVHFKHYATLISHFDNVAAFVSPSQVNCSQETYLIMFGFKRGKREFILDKDLPNNPLELFKSLDESVSNKGVWNKLWGSMADITFYNSKFGGAMKYTIPGGKLLNGAIKLNKICVDKARLMQWELQNMKSNRPELPALNYPKPLTSSVITLLNPSFNVKKADRIGTWSVRSKMDSDGNITVPIPLDKYEHQSKSLLGFNKYRTFGCFWAKINGVEYKDCQEELYKNYVHTYGAPLSGIQWPNVKYIKQYGLTGAVRSHFSVDRFQVMSTTAQLVKSVTGMPIERLPVGMASKTREKWIESIEKKLDVEHRPISEHDVAALLECGKGIMNYNHTPWGLFPWEDIINIIRKKAASGWLEDKSLYELATNPEVQIEVDKKLDMMMKGIVPTVVWSANHKREVRAGVDEPFPKPRIIQFMDGKSRLACLRLIGYIQTEHNLEKKMYWGSNTGRSITHVGDFMHEKWVKYKNPVCIMNDIKGWDNNVTCEQLACMSECFKPHFKPELHKGIETYFKLIMSPLVVDLEGVVFGRKGQVSSGEITTSRGNGWLNIALTVQMIREATGMSIEWIMEHVTILCEGDDLIMIMEKEFADRVLAYAKKFLVRVNKPPKMVDKLGRLQHTRRFWDISFCSHTYKPVPIAGKVHFLPHRPLPEILGKFSLTKKMEGTKVGSPLSREINRSKAISYLLLYPANPVIRKLCLLTLCKTGWGTFDTREFEYLFGKIVGANCLMAAVQSVYPMVKDLDDIGYFPQSVCVRDWEAVQECKPDDSMVEEQYRAINRLVRNFLTDVIDFKIEKDKSISISLRRNFMSESLAEFTYIPLDHKLEKLVISDYRMKQMLKKFGDKKLVDMMPECFENWDNKKIMDIKYVQKESPTKGEMLNHLRQIFRSLWCEQNVNFIKSDYYSIQRQQGIENRNSKFGKGIDLDEFEVGLLTFAKQYEKEPEFSEIREILEYRRRRSLVKFVDKIMLFMGKRFVYTFNE